MNIYFCREEQDFAGLYVMAKSRGRAKALFAGEIGCDYTDVRTSMYRKDVPEKHEGIIGVGDPLLEKYELAYEEEEPWE